MIQVGLYLRLPRELWQDAGQTFEQAICWYCQSLQTNDGLHANMQMLIITDKMETGSNGDMQTKRHTN